MVGGGSGGQTSFWSTVGPVRPYRPRAFTRPPRLETGRRLYVMSSRRPRVNYRRASPRAAPVEFVLTDRPRRVVTAHTRFGPRNLQSVSARPRRTNENAVTSGRKYKSRRTERRTSSRLPTKEHVCGLDSKRRRAVYDESADFVRLPTVTSVELLKRYVDTCALQTHNDYGPCRYDRPKRTNRTTTTVHRLRAERRIIIFRRRGRFTLGDR